MIFISHSFEDESHFADLSHAFADKGIPFFRPSELLAGRYLADQLREAIAKCSICVFVATHKAVKSNWCLAELGAFWGAGKTILVYVADGSLRDNQFPKEFDGQLRVRGLFKLIENVQKLLETQRKSSASPTVRALDLSVSDLRELIQESIDLTYQNQLLSRLIYDLALFYHSAPESLDAPLRQSQGRMMLRSLLGRALPPDSDNQSAGWNYRFVAPTTTGLWLGYALEAEMGLADDFLDLYRSCLLLLLDEHRQVIGAALADRVSLAHRALGLDSWTKQVACVVGSVGLGDAIPES